ncbi:MAG: hypothetical protein KDK71_06275 [Chlamydiia bacterium]|nr:hypothetical protein [Chlamydiia bacterium]
MVLLFVGCAKTATYKPRTAIVGYTDKHTYMNKFQVSFRGGKYTPMNQVWEWAYKRAAEVTIDNGYRYFVVFEEKEHFYNLSEDLKGEKDSTKDWADIGGPFPEVTLSFKCYKERPSNTDDAIDAEELLRGNVDVPASSS